MIAQFLNTHWQKCRKICQSIYLKSYGIEDRIRFCWTPKQQGLLKSAFFFGYIILQVHGGSLAEKFGTRIVLGISLLASSVITLMTPIGKE